MVPEPFVYFNVEASRWTAIPISLSSIPLSSIYEQTICSGVCIGGMFGTQCSKPEKNELTNHELQITFLSVLLKPLTLMQRLMAKSQIVSFL